MIRFVFQTLLVFIASSAAFAQSGHDRGNGGDVLICKDASGKITGARLFDLYEAEAKFGMKIVPLQSKTIDDKVNELISRVEKIDSARAFLFRRWYADFFKESKFIPGVELGDIPDQGDAFWPVNCKIAQLVVQTEMKPPLHPARYTFSQDLWNLLDDDSKAATILHELIYREARLRRHSASNAVRYFNGLFWADQFNHLSRRDYIKLILISLRLGLVTTSQGVPFWVEDSGREILQGIEFTLGSARFKIAGDDGCATFSWETGDCNGTVNHAPQMIKDPVLPEFLEKISIHTAAIGNGRTYFGGSFKLLAPYAFKVTEIGPTDDSDTWFVQKGDLILKIQSGKLIDAKYVLPRSVIETLNDLKLTIKNDELVKTSFVPQQEVNVRKYDNSNFYCKAGQQMIFDFEKLSCVLSKAAIIEDIKGQQVRVPAGKRVYLDSVYDLIRYAR